MNTPSVMSPCPSSSLRPVPVSRLRPRLSVSPSPRLLVPVPRLRLRLSSLVSRRSEGRGRGELGMSSPAARRPPTLCGSTPTRRCITLTDIESHIHLMTANEESFMRLEINYQQRLYKLRRYAAARGSFGVPWPAAGRLGWTAERLDDRAA